MSQLRVALLSGLLASSAVFINHLAYASDAPDAAAPQNTASTFSPFSPTLFGGGNNWARYEFSPNWSQELGLSLRGAFASHITNDIAVGLIAEYGENKREYLANAGFRLTDTMTFVGTVGLLEENLVFLSDQGGDKVQQTQYGVSLKSTEQFGLFHGYELNAYFADASAKSTNIETGKLFGLQILSNAYLTDMTRVRFGGGYEWLRWDEGEIDNSLAVLADVTHQLSDKLSANANVKFGASEYVYGAGLSYNLGDRADTNVVRVDFEHIEGRNGIQSDQRVMLSWSTALGAATGSNSDKLNPKESGSSRLNSNSAEMSSSNSLLGDLIKRPGFLPNRVLARKVAGPSCAAAAPWRLFQNSWFGTDYIYYGPTLPADLEILSITVDGVAFDLSNLVPNTDGYGLGSGSATAPDSVVIIRFTTGGVCYESTTTD